VIWLDERERLAWGERVIEAAIPIVRAAHSAKKASR
jgi:hypothetical protein